MKKVINFFNLKGPFGGPLGELLGYNEAIVESYEEYLKFIEKRLTIEDIVYHTNLCDLKELEFALEGTMKESLEWFYEFYRYRLSYQYQEETYETFIPYLGLAHFHNLDKLKSQNDNVVRSKLFKPKELIKKDKRRLLRKLSKRKPFLSNTKVFSGRKLITKKDYDHLTKYLEL